jgi:predicted nuclease of predicted toxin-antitoxin system
VKFIVDAQLPKSLSDFLNQKDLDAVHTLDLPNGNLIEITTTEIVEHQ